MLAIEIGERVRRLRTDAKISQGYLAKQMGCFQSVLSNIEKGLHCPSVDKLLPIADTLSCSLDYLVRGTEPASANTADRARANREAARLRSALENIIKFAGESIKNET